MDIKCEKFTDAFGIPMSQVSISMGRSSSLVSRAYNNELASVKDLDTIIAELEKIAVTNLKADRATAEYRFKVANKKIQELKSIRDEKDKISRERGW